LGDDATLSETTTQMNLISTVDQHLTIHLNKDSLRRWFKKNKGKEKRAVFRPLLTEDHKQTRLHFVREIHSLNEQGAIYSFEDKAWNYLWSKRKKMKHLPRAEFEEERADQVCVRHVISRSNPIKSMFMGVVFPPVSTKPRL
jgi:hypothetical protein